MKTKLAWLALGILLGAGVMQSVDYYASDLPYSRALDAANASVAAARKTIAEARAQQISERAGMTIITEIDAPAAPAPAAAPSSNAPNNVNVALGILGLITGRNLSGVAAMLPQSQPGPASGPGWHGFVFRGHVQPLATGENVGASYTFCDTEETCTGYAVIRSVTQADIPTAWKDAELAKEAKARQELQRIAAANGLGR